MFDLSGRVAVVTGAGRGIGQGIAAALAAAGADVLGVQRGAMDETEARVEDAGRRFLGLRADMADRATAPRIVATALEVFGRIDILVNNAGIIRRAEAVDMAEADWDDVLEVNLSAAFLLSRTAARHWIGAGLGGKVINIASMLSFQGGIRVAGYTASKSGLLGLTRLLANEWAARGINVNAIAPGYIRTDNTRALREDAARNAEILARIPAGRWGEPGDLGGAAVFLASAAADYVHGAVLPVDGGWLAR
ncbi:MAG: 2-dehydro-3-deoxy-D-gluconate 5-dehydrogenase KduD [Hyphomicrobiales bacterium]|nr:2-dehydro-3-deoxy-D-gluconate 5-dehydrogenase KduD [Hyphomicrobiales bacterium]MCP5370279.1 2-dehydro-3-deoxy-D-gluconate 5-dehydrogenase KduD [Hyphomicrobiales bacterium]